jgi:hypothetical protein
MSELCQVADSRVRLGFSCTERESGDLQCERTGIHTEHKVSEHTIHHSLRGNGFHCSAITLVERVS